ncbi:hypothetical protein AB0B66_08290 [Catellatospora sp. NPDC049111]|uniref:hypothetical protein n=1 Tax=Catellatospora sp. NPDC049111 TaxID=3155271 RepID=UPI0033C58597
MLENNGGLYSDEAAPSRPATYGLHRPLHDKPADHQEDALPLAGLTLPAVSAYDPPVSGEGSLDPVGLASISDRLADLLVPGLRARMGQVRFVTAIAVGSLACEPLAEQVPADGISTPAICFEWLAVEAFVRKLGKELPSGIPGSQKARAVLQRSQRLSAATYLKGPSVFGFNGVYKPFAVDARVVGPGLEPGTRCADLVRAWEHDQDLKGFTDDVPGTTGHDLRKRIRLEVQDALAAGGCRTAAGNRVFGQLAAALRPDDMGPTERRVLRSLITDPGHETRAELAGLVADLDPSRYEAELLESVRPRCSPALARIVDAVVAYEQFAALVDAGFRTLCSISYSLGGQPFTPAAAREHETIRHCADHLPASYRRAADAVAQVLPDAVLEHRLGELAFPRTPAELAEQLLAHHEQVQAGKPPHGRRPWFEPLRGGWVVRKAYGAGDPPQLGPWFVHPVRVAPLLRFMKDTADE